jgi:short-subunit dehydrogenase
MKHVVIIGATSTIAQWCARRWAERGDRLLLVARDSAKLEEIAQDLRVRSPNGAIATYVMDATNVDRIPLFLEFALQRDKHIDAVLIAHGTLPEQMECERSLQLALRTIEINGTSSVAWMVAFAALFEEQRFGTLAAIGSPAGDRGRASNYTYGAAKSLVHTYAEGLRHRFWRSGVRVLLLKPGFVDTPMTARFDKKGPLWSSAFDVARDIVRAIDQGDGTKYVPWFWRYIMLIIKHLPWFVFRRMSI